MGEIRDCFILTVTCDAKESVPCLLEIQGTKCISNVYIILIYISIKMETFMDM